MENKNSVQLIKKDSVIVDINGTLFEKDGTKNEIIIEVVKLLSKKYFINMITAHYYETLDKFKEDNKEILDLADTYNYNNNPNDKDDAEIKKNIYEQVIKPKYNVKFVIDNNKHVIKQFRKLGLTALMVKPPKN